MSQGRYEPRGALGRAVNAFEEGAIAALLGLMTILTFVNVFLRYIFNSSIIWSLEVVLVLFAWLVLFGIAYGFKVTAHLGVDAILNVASPGLRRGLVLASGLVCLIWALLLLKGAWDYWAPFANLPPTEGRWFPVGIDWDVRRTPYIETDEIPIPFDWFKSWLETTFNWYMDGDERVVEPYSEMPRLVPYAILPVAALLILFRVGEAVLRLWRGEVASLIVSHEAEDAVSGVPSREERA